MNDRKPIFKAFRDYMGGTLTQPQVDAMDALLDQYTPAGNRKTSQRGIDLIHSFESLKLTAYPDPGTGGKPWTIGWGSTTDENGNPIPPSTVWTKERADARFAKDLTRFESAVSKLIGNTPTTQGQFDALVSFAYNVGEGPNGLAGSTLLRKHNARDYKSAAAEFARWNRSGGRVMAGLTRRRKAEAELYQS